MTIDGVGTYQATATQNPPAVYEELSTNYDVRNATFEEIVEISNVLYNSGEITLKEHAVITFDFERATNNLKQNAPGTISSDFICTKRQ